MGINTSATELPRPTAPDHNVSTQDAGYQNGEGTKFKNTKLEDLLFDLDMCLGRVEDDLLEAGNAMAQALLYLGCRAVLFQGNVFVIHGYEIVDFSNEAEAVDLLATLELDCPSPYHTGIMWDYALAWLEYHAMSLQKLIGEYGLSGSDWDVKCKTVADKKALIELLYQEFGPDFFQLEPCARDDYRDAIPAFILPATTNKQ